TRARRTATGGRAGAGRVLVVHRLRVAAGAAGRGGLRAALAPAATGDERAKKDRADATAHTSIYERRALAICRLSGRAHGASVPCTSSWRSAWYSSGNSRARFSFACWLQRFEMPFFFERSTTSAQSPLASARNFLRFSSRWCSNASTAVSLPWI